MRVVHWCVIPIFWTLILVGVLVQWIGSIICEIGAQLHDSTLPEAKHDH